MCVCVCVCVRARLAALVYVPTPFKVVIISRISNRSLTTVVTQICSTGLELSSDRQFGGGGELISCSNTDVRR